MSNVVFQRFRRAAEVIADKILPDQRLRFYDLSKLKRSNRKPRSQVLQFYSAVDNIGNYTPVLGIREMLGFSPDTWDCHAKVDWEYVNRNYKAIIIGGAGLLHGDFTPFWEDVAQGCQLPKVVWGVGGCFPESELAQTPAVKRDIAKSVFDRCSHINLRDLETASFYRLTDCHISMCPTVLWLRQFRGAMPRHRLHILLAEHVELVPKETSEERQRLLESAGVPIVWTDNVQRRFYGVQRLITELYMKSRFVVATRLHGAIIAHGLNIPYVVRVYDKKLEAFVNEWGGGVIAKTDEDVLSLLQDERKLILPFKLRDEARIEEFGATVHAWLHELQIEPTSQPRSRGDANT